MKTKNYLTFGETESGDRIPSKLWDHYPTMEEVLDHYRDIIPVEFDAFGDEHMATLIEVGELVE